MWTRECTWIACLLASEAEGTGSVVGEGPYVRSALLASAAEGTGSVVGEGGVRG